MTAIEKKLIQFCNNLYNDEVKTNLNKLINEYLSYENSSINVVLQCLEDGIQNNSVILTSKLIRNEIEMLSGKKYIDDEKRKEQDTKILLSYETIDLGNEIFDEKALADLNVNLGVIDINGVYHPSERKNIPYYNWPDHREIAAFLKEKDLIIEHYIRVGTVCGINEGILGAESINYGDKDSLKRFLLTEKMAIALYNAVMSKKGKRFTTFEEKLAYFGNEFGYFSTKYNVVHQIYNYELFDNNVKVLSYTLGKKFDRHFFKQILESKNK